METCLGETRKSVNTDPQLRKQPTPLPSGQRSNLASPRQILPRSSAVHPESLTKPALRVVAATAPVWAPGLQRPAPSNIDSRYPCSQCLLAVSHYPRPSTTDQSGEVPYLVPWKEMDLMPPVYPTFYMNWPCLIDCLKNLIATRRNRLPDGQQFPETGR
jgi:hypothetical protein